MGNCVNHSDAVEGSMIKNYEGSLAEKQIESPPGSGKSTRKLAVAQIYKSKLRPPKFPSSYHTAYNTIEKLYNSKDSQSLAKLGKAYQSIKLYNNAIAVYKQILSQAESQQKNKIQFYLGECLLQIGKTPEAVAIFTRISQQQKKYGKRKENISLLKYKGSCYFSLGQIAASIQSFQQAIRLYEQFALANTSQYIGLLCKLTEVYIGEGKIRLAADLTLKSLKVASQLPQNLETAIALIEISAICQTLGASIKAENLLKVSEDLIIKLAGKESLQYVRLLFAKSIFYNELAKYPETEMTLKESHKLIVDIFGEQSIQFCEINLYEGLLCLSNNNSVQAITFLKTSLQKLEFLDEQLSQVCPFILIQLMVAYSRIGSYSKSQRACKQAFKLIQKIYQMDSVQSAEIGNKFVMVLFESGFIEAALNGCKQILRIYEVNSLQVNGNYRRMKINLGHIYLLIGQRQMAYSIFNNILQILEKQSEDSPIYVQVCQLLAEMSKKLHTQDEKIFKKGLLLEQRSKNINRRLSLITKQLQDEGLVGQS